MKAILNTFLRSILHGLGRNVIDLRSWGRELLLLAYAHLFSKNVGFRTPFLSGDAPRTGGVLSCGEGKQQFKVLLGLANCAEASLRHCTKLGWIDVYTFAKFASALVNFSYKFVDGNTTFNDRPLTDLKIKCVQS